MASATTANCAFAQTLAGSAFEIDTDANLKVDATGPTNTGCIDWLTNGNESDPLRPGVIAQPDLPSGQADNSFTQGSKEDTANPVIEFGGIPPNKSDLSWFGVYTEQNPPTPPDGNLALFWSRVQDPSGTTNMDFELNQKFCDTTVANDPNCSTNGVTPVRTVGDILITYDLSRGGTVATISIRRWEGTQWGPADALDNTEARGTINTSTISQSPLDTAQNPTGSLSPRTFGEAIVSFEALFGQGECGSFGSAYLKSRSSDSFTSALKDFVPPTEVEIGNCPSGITTTATQSVELGNPITDTAHLNVGDGAGGTITFNLYGPDDADCSEPIIFTSDVAVDGGGDYTSDPFTPTETGSYNWVAIYSGDATTDGSETECGDPGETSTVTSVPSSLTTAQSFIPNDSATVSAPGGGALLGTVTFTVFESADCSGTALYTEDVAVSGPAAGTTVSTTNTTESTTAANVSWLVGYDSDNPAQDDITATCTEKTALAINNG